MSTDEHAGVVLYDPGLAGGDHPELIWRSIAGRTLFAWAVQAAGRVRGINGFVVVVPAERTKAAEALMGTVAGGAERAAVLAAPDHGLAAALSRAIEALPAQCRWVVTHDLARPLMAPELVVAGLAAARQTGAASASEPVKETIKRVANGNVVGTVERSRLRLLQTPQVFERDQLVEACARYPAGGGAQDAATIALAAGLAVVTFPGGPDNLAVRSEDDLDLAERLLLQRRGSVS